MPSSPTLQQRFQVWIAGGADETMLRGIFRVVLTATVAVLALDLASMNGWNVIPDSSALPAEVRQDSATPALVPAIFAPPTPVDDKRLLPSPQPDGVLAKPMTFELVGGGRLMATGAITPGISQTFAAEIGKRGDYIRTVVLNSSGGSVSDALAMGRLIREKKFATEVEAGKYCASSCPLVFAGGVERRAGDRAAIGVHQISALGPVPSGPASEDMSLAQSISARCQRYLAEMGIDLQVWVHAMETPHDRLFVFKPDELKSLNMVTAAPTPAPIAAPVATKARS